MQKRALSLCHLLPLLPQLYEKIVAPSWHILSPDSPSCGASPPAWGWMDSRVQLAHEFVMEKTNVLDCNQSSLHLIINLKPISKCLQIFYSFFRPESWLSVNYNSKITPITTKGTALFSKGAPKTIHFKYTWMEYIISCVNIRAELFFFPEIYGPPWAMTMAGQIGNKVYMISRRRKIQKPIYSKRLFWTMTKRYPYQCLSSSISWQLECYVCPNTCPPTGSRQRLATTLRPNQVKWTLLRPTFGIPAGQTIECSSLVLSRWPPFRNRKRRPSLCRASDWNFVTYKDEGIPVCGA